jgi:5-(carboxyamino)imidazole ribonucleotide synthase
VIPPGKTIGVLGGGQLGRMLAHAAQALGYKVFVYDPSGHGPAAGAADRVVQAPYEDIAALTAFARSVDVITYEFENVPFEPLEAIAGLVPLHPRAEVLRICQNRQREKAWLRANGIAHARYAEALDGDVAAAVAQVGRPCVIKTADFGYDGKGQMKVTTDDDLEKATAIFRGRRCVVEKWIDFQREVSVICARNAAGERKTFPVAENIHRHHILDFSIVPARVSEAVAREAEAIAASVAEKLGVVGLIAVEFFVTVGGEVLVNELAPRTHNSGHWSLDAAPTSQFEQQVRAVCGLPLGPVEPFGPTVMVNILGDAWKWKGNQVVGEPNWAAVLGEPKAKLHLYGKDEPRPGRKMGHFTVRDATIEGALALAESLQARL